MRKVMAVSSVVLSLLASAVFASPASADITFPPDEIVPPPTGRITIDVVTVNGTGCKRGTVETAVSPDNEAFTITYSEYMAQIGPESKPTDFRKNCQINVRVNAPGGFTYAVAKVQYRGFAHLERGASSVQKARYYFQGMPESALKTYPLPRSPYSSDWENLDETPVAALVWHPCGAHRLFNINTSLEVKRGTSDRNKTSFATMDSTDGSIKTIYHFAWARCRS